MCNWVKIGVSNILIHNICPITFLRIDVLGR